MRLDASFRIGPGVDSGFEGQSKLRCALLSPRYVHEDHDQAAWVLGMVELRAIQHFCKRASTIAEHDDDVATERCRYKNTILS